MKKIAYINTEFLPVPPTKGGAVEGWIESVSHQLAQHQIYVFSIFQDALKASQQQGHVQYFWFRLGVISKVLLSTYKLPFKNANSRLYYLPYALWCAWKLRKINPDIIHIHNRPHFVWIIKKLNPKAKIILHFHQLSAMEKNGVWDQKLIENVNLFVGCSKFIIDELCNIHSIDQSKVAVAYNALDMNKFPGVWSQQRKRELKRQKLKVDQQKVILYVGRLAENKGAHLLIEAVRELVSEGHENLRLIMCGARGYANREVTPYIQHLYDLAKGLNGHISFEGYVPHDKILEYYLASDLVVIPSEVAEGFCRITIESMACGIPVIASGRGGIKEIIEDKSTGSLVEPTVENFKVKISEFLNEEEVFKVYAKKGHSRVKDLFTWERVSRDMEKAYEGLVSHG